MFRSLLLVRGDNYSSVVTRNSRCSPIVQKCCRPRCLQAYEKWSICERRGGDIYTRRRRHCKLVRWGKHLGETIHTFYLSPFPVDESAVWAAPAMITTARTCFRPAGVRVRSKRQQQRCSSLNFLMCECYSYTINVWASANTEKLE